MRGRRSRVGDALICVLLLVAFLAIAGAIVGVVGWIGLRFWRLGKDPSSGVGPYGYLLAGACWAVVAAVVWSILPRRDRFKPPGPELTARDQPALFHELAQLAAQVGQPMPRHVYVDGDMNAAVAQRGGVLGIGSARTMVIGLPLLGTLTVSELRAVLAHELGHFHAGDTALLPWTYRTRLAIARTLQNLDEVGEVFEEATVGARASLLMSLFFSAVQAPFEWFGAGFLWLTQGMSREQELHADELAVRIAGSVPLIHALRKIEAAAPLFAAYLEDDVGLVLGAGLRPPIIDGFRQVCSGDTWRWRLVRVLQESHAVGDAHAFDSHPPLHERAEAARKLAVDAPSEDRRSAIELIADVAAMERRVFGGGALDGSPVSWDEAFARAVAPSWREDWLEWRSILVGLTPESVPVERRALRRLMERRFGKYVSTPSPADAARWAAHVFGTSITLALLDAGHRASAHLGTAVSVSVGDLVVTPYDEVLAYASGATSAAAWAERMRAIGIAHVDLGLLGAAGAATSALEGQGGTEGGDAGSPGRVGLGAQTSLRLFVQCPPPRGYDMLAAPP